MSDSPMGRVGIAVTCARCQRMKKPIGRDARAGAGDYCTATWASALDGCEGYYATPFPGALWPGETEADYGYPVGRNGTREVSV